MSRKLWANSSLAVVVAMTIATAPSASAAVVPTSFDFQRLQLTTKVGNQWVPADTTKVTAWQTLRLEGTVCATASADEGDSTIIEAPVSMAGFPNGVYPLKDPDQNTVATMTISGGNVLTITWSPYVDQRQHVCANFSAASQVNEMIQPDKVFSYDFVVGGKTYEFPVVGASCPNCSGPPPANSEGKWGSYNAEVITVQSHKVTTANEVVNVTDTMTSGAQTHLCTKPVAAQYFTTRNAWGNPADLTSKGLLVKTSDCTNTVRTVTVTGAPIGAVVRVFLPVDFDTSTGASAWTDKAVINQAGQTFTKTATVLRSAGGDGSGVVPIKVPGLKVVKSAVATDTNKNGVLGDAGDTIAYKFVTSNTGETNLTKVDLQDAMLAAAKVNVTCPGDTIALGKDMTCTSAPYVITAADVKAGKVVNAATVKTGEVPSTQSNTVEVPTKETPKPPVVDPPVPPAPPVTPPTKPNPVIPTPSRPSDLVTSSVSVSFDCKSKMATETTYRRVVSWAWDNLAHKWVNTTPVDSSEVTKRRMTRSELAQCKVPPVKMVNRTFQVDRYMPLTQVLANGVAALDNDGRLGRGEDWLSRVMRPMLAQTRWQIVTVRVPVKASWRTVAAAINAKTSKRIGDITTSARLARAKARGTYIMAWEVTPQSWLIGRNVKKFNKPQIYFGRG